MTENYIILGDIGGTKSRFVYLRNLESEFSEIKFYTNSNYSSFEEVFSEYLTREDIKERNILFLAVAGPVIKGEAFLTNLSWKISIRDIKKRFQFKKIILVNDLYALSGCMFYLKEGDLKPIKKAHPIKNYPKAFLAPGTGLGISFLISKNPLKILPSEGGHIPFSPQSEEEFEFLKYLKAKNKSQTYEETLSGRGLSNWYAFFTGKELSPQEITNRAKNGEKEALMVIKKFFELLGRKCYEISVSLQPFGGIYLTGGVLDALREFLEQREILQGFYENFYFFEHMKRLIENIPIYLILHPFPVLLGALTILHSQLR